MKIRVLAALLLSIVTPASAAVLVESPATPERVGSLMARVTSMDLGVRERQSSQDFHLAASAFALASDLNPTDADIARRMAEAAWLGGDQDQLIDATRRIIRADPLDTVAQLRLISSSINGRQTVEARLAAYDRFLSRDGRSLDRSVRSRLALDAALLHREQGDNDGFLERLELASELDQTNKEAASLRARVLGEGATAVQQLRLQIALLYADPLDPHVHLTIARLCAAEGAFESADRFLSNGVDILRAATGTTPETLSEQRLALLWTREGPERVLKELNGPLAEERATAASLIEARLEIGEPIDDITPPEDLRYSPGIERVRLLAAHVLDDQESLDLSMADMTRSTIQMVQQMTDALNRRGADVDGIQRAMIKGFTDQQVMRGITGREPDQIRTELELFREGLPHLEYLLERIEPWAFFAAGEYENTLERARQLEGLRPIDSLAIAAASEKLGDSDTAAEIYKDIARRLALDAYGSYSRSRLVAMGREDEVISETGQRLERELAKVPAWIDMMTRSPDSFMSLRAVTSEGAQDATSPARLEIRLTNVSPIPLSLGVSRAIGSRLLIAPRLVIAESGVMGEPVPRVVDLDRRIRLAPREEIRVWVEADAPYTAWLREVNAHTSLRERYRVIQSFRPTVRGGLVNGPMALATESPIQHWDPVPSAQLEPGQLEERVRGSDSSELGELLVASVSILMREALDNERNEGARRWPIASTEQKRALGDAWTERFARATDLERAMIVLMLPHSRQVPELSEFDGAVNRIVVGDAIERAKLERTLAAAVLISRTRDPESPLFELIDPEVQPKLAALAAGIQARLADGQVAFATVGPGVDAMAPSGQALERAAGP